MSHFFCGPRSVLVQVYALRECLFHSQVLELNPVCSRYVFHVDLHIARTPSFVAILSLMLIHASIDSYSAFLSAFSLPSLAIVEIWFYVDRATELVASLGSAEVPCTIHISVLSTIYIPVPLHIRILGVFSFFLLKKRAFTRMHNLSGRMTSHPDRRLMQMDNKNAAQEIVTPRISLLYKPAIKQLAQVGIQTILNIHLSVR